MISPLLIYIHGFNSSPLSQKASEIKSYCEEHRQDIKVIIPQLPCYPEQAKQTLLDLVDAHKDDHQIGLVGSSLGGYFCIWLNALYGFRAVVINPAVKPYELLNDYLGEQVNPYTNERYVLKHEHVEQLRALDVPKIKHPSDFWLLQQKGDEVLDYRQAEAKFIDARTSIEEGGDHSFVNFSRYSDQIVEFLSL